ncbi:UNVERIFIED_CONTAM: hypothetical protein PYX00_000441 [Menopon gallinae]|uniref:EF-hand calcium-binding domain-containing protein 14 n=1 Tax=Menopon gallinae TaxID=328185 RepID=A0AAW2IB68_9NEOP
MDSVAHVNVPLRGGKKMKKRKELDALVAHTINKRCVDVKRSSSVGGISSHDQLLTDSTDEQDYWTSSTGGKPLRCQRRRYSMQKRTCSALLRACSGILIFSCVVATTAVMWLFIDVRAQVTSLRTELNQVVAGSQGVPDALQKCHSLSRELQKNQSQIMDRLTGFSLLLNNFSSEMTEVKNGLHTVQDQLKSSPDLINNPTIVHDLTTSVGTFGSQIKGLEASVSSLKDQHLKLDSVVNNLVSNVTGIRSEMTELLNKNREKAAFTDRNFAAEKENILSVINQVSMNVTSVNDTLSNKLQWTVDDRSKDHKLIESLQEMNANVTARVTSLERLCAKEAKIPPKTTPTNQPPSPSPPPPNPAALDPDKKPENPT